MFEDRSTLQMSGFGPPWAYRDSRGKGKFPTKLFPLRSIRQVLTQLNLEDTKI